MKIFISYKIEDLERFRIPEIAVALEEDEKIEQVFYWNRDHTIKQTLNDYMTQSISISDVVIFICSKEALISPPIQLEVDTALQHKKKIIPIYRTFANVRPSLRQYRGVEFKDNDFIGFMSDLLGVLAIKIPSLLQNYQNMILTGPFIDLIDFKPKYEKSIYGSIQSSHLNSYIAKNKRDFLLAHDRIEKIGLKINIYHILNTEYKDPPPIQKEENVYGYLSDKIKPKRNDKEIKKLIMLFTKGIIIVKDTRIAKEYLKKNKKIRNVITLDGEIVKNYKYYAESQKKRKYEEISPELKYKIKIDKTLVDIQLNKNLMKIIKTHDLEVVGPLIDIIEYNPEHGIAIGAIIDKRTLDSYILTEWEKFRLLTELRNQTKAKCHIYYPKPGEVNSFPNMDDKITEGIYGYLADQIHCESNPLAIKKVLYSKLKNIVLVKDKSIGYDFIKKYNHQGKIVTLDGIILENNNGIMVIHPRFE